MTEQRRRVWWAEGLPGVGMLWVIGAIADRLWFTLDHSVPGWDQGGHLTRAMMYWRLVQQADWLSGAWWHSFWAASTKYPPLIYGLTVPFFNLFGTSFDTATLINLPFSAILLLSVYGLGAYLFTMPAGLMAAAICWMMPGLYRVRLDYLIDYPLVALVTLSFLCLTVWWGKAKGQWQFQNEKLDPANSLMGGSDLHKSALHKSGLEGSGLENPDNVAEAITRQTSESSETQTKEQAIAGRSAPNPRDSISRIQPSATLASETTSAEPTEPAARIHPEDLNPENLTLGQKLGQFTSSLGHKLWQGLGPCLWQWLWAIAFGFSLGLALLVKQTAFMFFLFPLLWVTLVSLRQLAWVRLLQLAAGLAVSTSLMLPWVRASWLLILTSVQSSTVEPALSEGDPSLNSLDNWLYYLVRIPQLVSWVWLLPLIGLVFYWKRSSLGRLWLGHAEAQIREQRTRAYQSAQRSLLWLVLFLVGSYLLNSLNPNKDVRYIMPVLPVIAIILGVGWTLLPQAWRLGRWRLPGWLVRWGIVGWAIALTLYHLFPSALSNSVPLHLQTDYATRRAYTDPEFPLHEIVETVIKADPYEKSTIGLLNSLPDLNQHNLTYYGLQRDFQVYARDVGSKRDRTEAEVRALSWFIAQTGGEPMPRQTEAKQAITQRLNSAYFKRVRTWELSDRRQFSLYQRRTPYVEVQPLPLAPPSQLTPNPSPTPSPSPSPSPTESPAQAPAIPILTAPIQLVQVTVPPLVPPGKPVPVTYTWSGSWTALQSGLVLINWRWQPSSVDPLPEGAIDSKSPPKPPQITTWLHDHAIANGSLQVGLPTWVTAASDFRLTERLAMLPPAQAQPGTYTLEVFYQNRKTGETVEIAPPPLRLTLDPTAKPVPTSLDVDLLTRLRNLATLLPQGTTGLDKLFQKVEVMNQYNPGQDYLTQTQQAMDYRLRQEPQNRNFAYTLALSQVLKKDVPSAIAAFQRLTQLDTQNPYAYAYLAFVNLYALQPAAAQIPLDTALKLSPTLAELHLLKGVATLLQGDIPGAWRFVQSYQKLAKQK